MNGKSKRGRKMKIEIKDYCIRCGICVGLYPELFAHNFKEDVIDVLRNPDTEELANLAKNAVKDCAVTAIYLNS